jgi:hypothetical protein
MTGAEQPDPSGTPSIAHDRRRPTAPRTDLSAFTDASVYAFLYAFLYACFRPRIMGL